MANNTIENRANRRTRLAMAGTLALGALVGGAVAVDAQSPSPIVTEGTMPSLSPEAVHLEAIRIASPEDAALRFGADAYSSNPSNWEINEWGGAHLLETGKAVEAYTSGTVVEGWIKSKMVGARDALTFVADPSVPVVELNGGTFWDFGPENSRAGFAQVLGQVQAKEAVEQPDVLVIPLCADLTPIETTDVPVLAVTSARTAAFRFGVDAYSSDPSNWEINEWGGAHLKDNPNGNASLVNLDGATLEGWIKANRVNGRDAITFVVHSNVGQARVDGGTFWNFTDSDRGFQQLLGQVLSKEAVEQPDVTVLPAYNCVNTTVVEK